MLYKCQSQQLPCSKKEEHYTSLSVTVGGAGSYYLGYSSVRVGFHFLEIYPSLVFLRVLKSLNRPANIYKTIIKYAVEYDILSYMSNDYSKFVTLNSSEKLAWVECLEDTERFIRWLGKDMYPAADEFIGLIEWYKWVIDNPDVFK